MRISVGQHQLVRVHNRVLMRNTTLNKGLNEADRLLQCQDIDKTSEQAHALGIHTQQWLGAINWAGGAHQDGWRDLPPAR